jgi:hypothetical protein
MNKKYKSYDIGFKQQLRCGGITIKSKRIRRVQKVYGLYPISLRNL